MKFSVNPDHQGPDLRLPCLADYLELQAIKGPFSYNEAYLADFIRDNGWTRLLKHRVTNGPDTSDEDLTDAQERDICLEHATSVFDVIKQRLLILGDNYPFSIDEHSRLTWSKSKNSYLWLLCLSILHAARINFEDPLHNQFERSVTTAFRDKGLEATTIGTSAGTRNLQSCLDNICQQFPNLKATPDAAYHRVHANDSGGDTFAMLTMERDNRPSKWAFIGQSTVAQSSDWGRKITEVHPNSWNRYFADSILTIPFFATPYHVENRYLKLLNQDHGTGIFDRLRLSAWLNDTPDTIDGLLEKIVELDLN
jgi:hypothetical protein